MALPILAHWAGRSIFDIEPAALARRGIRLLLADLDNTLAPYGEPEPTQAVRDWAAALGEQGITLFVLSNNRHPERPRRFSQALGVPFLGHAGKPKPGGFRRAMEQMSCTPEQTAIVGDQLFTDILGGRNAGVFTTGGAHPVGGQSGALPALRSGVALPHVEQKEDKTVMSAIFGPAGNAESFPYKSSADAPRWLAELGLDCYEYQCGKGVNVREETARNIGAAAVAAGIRLSLHAPYFINLANPDPESLQKTIGYITAACQAADWMGAGRVVIHSGALMKRTRREALDIALRSLKAVIAACDDAGYGHIALCPETMGKINQLGDLDEVLELCTLDERLVPCVDFGHLYARSLGELEGTAACASMLDRIREVLGEVRAGVFHSHFSKIQFTPNGGEKMHLTFAQDDFGPDPAPLMAEVARRGWSPTFICESAGTQAEDALTMKRLYQAACG